MIRRRPSAPWWPVHLAVSDIVTAALPVALFVWTLFRDAERGCIRALRGGCDSSVSVPSSPSTLPENR